MNMNATLADIRDAIEAAPQAFAVIPVPNAPADGFHHRATLDANQLKAALQTGLPLLLVQQTTTGGLLPVGVRAEYSRQLPQPNGKVESFSTRRRDAGEVLARGRLIGAVPDQGAL